jgi:hypothetical protein
MYPVGDKKRKFSHELLLAFFVCSMSGFDMQIEELE